MVPKIAAAEILRPTENTAIARSEMGKTPTSPGGQRLENKNRVSAAVRAIGALIDQQQSSETKNDDRHRESIGLNQRTIRAVLCYSLLTAVIALAGIYAAVQSRRAVSKARIAVMVAQRQAAISEDTEMRQVRAYAFPTPIAITHFAVNDKPAGGIFVKTMGQTPAYKVRAQAAILGLPYPLRPEQNLRLERSDAVKASAFISPTNRFDVNITADEKWDQRAIDMARDGKVFRLYVWGRVDYEDVFATPHWFTFCYSYDGISIDERGGGEPCSRHNDDDHH